MSDNRLSAAERQARWRAANPDRAKVAGKRRDARASASRKMRRLNPALFERMYREECEARGVKPYGPTEPDAQ